MTQIVLSETAQDQFDELSPAAREKLLRVIEQEIELAWMDDEGEPT